MQVCAYDYASQTEPNRDCSVPVQVDVDNSCADSAVAGGEMLSARFARSNDDSVTVPFRAAAKVAGELTNSAGDPIAGATICVEEELQGSRQSLAPVATTVTNAQGSFTYTVPPGPNRKVLLGYRHDTFQVARAIRSVLGMAPPCGGHRRDRDARRRRDDLGEYRSHCIEGLIFGAGPQGVCAPPGPLVFPVRRP